VEVYDGLASLIVWILREYGLCNVLPDVRVVKCWRLRWAGRVARMDVTLTEWFDLLKAIAVTNVLRSRSAYVVTVQPHTQCNTSRQIDWVVVLCVTTVAKYVLTEQQGRIICRYIGSNGGLDM